MANTSFDLSTPAGINAAELAIAKARLAQVEEAKELLDSAEVKAVKDKVQALLNKLGDQHPIRSELQNIITILDNALPNINYRREELSTTVTRLSPPPPVEVEVVEEPKPNG